MIRRLFLATLGILALACLVHWSFALPADDQDPHLENPANKKTQEKVIKALDAAIPPVAEGAVLKIVPGVPDRVRNAANRYATSRSGSLRHHTGAEGMRFIRDEWKRFSLEAPMMSPPGLESVVIVDAIRRPALLACPNGIIDLVPDPWATVFDTNKEKIRDVILRTGFIGTDQPFLKNLGTCFLIAPGVVLTNRHVAESFANPDLTLKASQIPGSTGKMKVTVTFSRYVCNTQGAKFDVAEVLHIEQSVGKDLALLRLDDPDTKLPTPLQLKKDPPGTLAKRQIYVCGNPSLDAAGDIPSAALDLLFGGVLGVKRVSPGEVLEGSDQQVLYHDCTTLGGNSGSPVIDLESGEVIGLHWAGIYKEKNYALPSWRIREIPKVAQVLQP